MAVKDVELTELPRLSDTAVRLAEIRATTGLKMPDCCVLLAAEDRHVRVATFDDRLVRAAVDRSLTVIRP